jgi:glycosyltransferase involved in cell wall biosynthesis
MVKRIKLGLIFNYNENWIGGTYYILNLIKLLNKLSVFKRPTIFVFYYCDTNLDVFKSLKYPDIKFVSIEEELYSNSANIKINLVKKVLNFISRRIICKNLFNNKSYLEVIDLIFPSDFNEIFRHSINQVYWIPDFQDRYLKNLFSQEELIDRKEWQSKISRQKHIIFSSYDALNDFKSFFPESDSKCYVFNFVSLIEKIKYPKFDYLSKKYNIKNKKYFFVSNQFWQHKNHRVVFEAMRILKEKETLNFNIYFSGNHQDYRNLNYFNELIELIEKYNLTEDVYLLGFIDRIDQISFMKHSVGVIQPSLFEGWSTVIEDAKALKKNIICSNLNVHFEQLGDLGFYFDPNNPEQLSRKMTEVINKNIVIIDYNYNNKIKEQSKNIYNIIFNIINS